MQRFVCALSRQLKKISRMSESLSILDSTNKDMVEDRKRKSDVELQHTETAEKKPKSETETGRPEHSEGERTRKRKVAALIAYNGKGYHGLQRNPPFMTIEEEIMKALLTVGAIPKDHYSVPQKMSFQRAARTDKGVSAASNVISLKIEDLIQKINAELPEQIRFFGYLRTTKSFDSKIWCSGRSYAYILPTYALAPVDLVLTDEYRITDEILDRVNEVLALYVGTHNFHNYTSGIKPNEQRARRYMVSFKCGKPFVREGIEFVTCTVQGQSFLLHHIRKMIGMMIAVVKGYCGIDAIQKTWGNDKVDVPKAPGLGLLLDELYYKHYNEKWGTNGIHCPIDWSEYQDERMRFKEEYILPEIFKTEKEERVMMQWLGTLQLHTFDVSTNQVYIRRKQTLKSIAGGTPDKKSGDQDLYDTVDTGDGTKAECTETTTDCKVDTGNETNVECSETRTDTNTTSEKHESVTTESESVSSLDVVDKSSGT